MFETVVSWNQTSYVPTFGSSRSQQPKLHCCVSLFHCFAEGRWCHIVKGLFHIQWSTVNNPNISPFHILLQQAVELSLQFQSHCFPPQIWVCARFVPVRSFSSFQCPSKSSNIHKTTVPTHSRCTFNLSVLPTFELVSSQESARWYLLSKFQFPQCCHLSIVSPSKAPLFLSSAPWHTYQ